MAHVRNYTKRERDLYDYEGRKYILLATRANDPLELPVYACDTIGQMAEWAGVDQSTVWRYVNGENKQAYLGETRLDHNPYVFHRVKYITDEEELETEF